MTAGPAQRRAGGFLRLVTAPANSTGKTARLALDAYSSKGAHLGFAPIAPKVLFA
jgi:hypothetical protein